MLPNHLLMGLLLVVAMVANATALRADETQKIDCETATATTELNACADQDFEAADAELNTIYGEALKAIPEMAGEAPYDAQGWEGALRASQRAWVAYRDAECNDHVAMFWTGGTGATADIIGCKADMTRARTKALKERYADEQR